MNDFKLSGHFSYFELTNTSYIKSLNKNRKKGIEYKDNLKVLCENILEPIRNIIGNKAIYVNSGFRYPYLNWRVGGSLTSQHLTGDACDWWADINLKSIFRKLYSGVLTIDFGQMIFYPEHHFIHISNPRKNKTNNMVMQYDIKHNKYNIILHGNYK